MMRDQLKEWRRIRQEIDWAAAGAPIVGPIVGSRDGIVEFVRNAGRARGRTARLLAALQQVRLAADTELRLSFRLLARWQGVVLGAPVSGFRSEPAFAKRGRERYGLHFDTADDFNRCLLEAMQPDVPLAARAARAYLDVAFFHPFTDGNGRAAMMTLYFILLREQVVIDLAEPVLRTVRRADDAAGALDLVRLLDVLISATRLRSQHMRSGDQSGRLLSHRRELSSAPNRS